MLEPDADRVMAERREMLQDPYVLDHEARPVVLTAIQRHCAYRGWNLHVHIIVEAETRPERVMNEFKSYASRELKQLEIEGCNRKRWARHGSTRWLWKDDDVRNALRYVIDGQGEPMSLFVSDEL